MFYVVLGHLQNKYYHIVNQKGSTIGVVTSGTMSPFFNKGFGISLVKGNILLPNPAAKIIASLISDIIQQR